MTATKEYSAMLYALADEVRSQEGCVTESPERIEDAAQRLDEQTVELNNLRRVRDQLLAACTRQVENIERWLETDIPAGQEESKSIYEQMVAAIAATRDGQ